MKRQTRHNALKPLEIEPEFSSNTTGQRSYREVANRITKLNDTGKSEVFNINHALELTEENMKLYEENLKELDREEDYEFYSEVNENE